MIFQQLPVQFLDVRNACRIDSDAGECAGVRLNRSRQWNELYANQLPARIETLIVRLKGEKPHWGGRKTGELVVRRPGGEVSGPKQFQ
jgi:hypothetical protein